MSWWQLLLLELAFALFGTMLYCAISLNNDRQSYRYVDSEITISTTFDKLENKKDAVDSCKKIIEDNGYVLFEMDTGYIGNKSFVTVKARKYNKKISE